MYLKISKIPSSKIYVNFKVYGQFADPIISSSISILKQLSKCSRFAYKY